MKILAYKDLILAYIRKDYVDNEQKILIEKIFYNENSVFLYSQKFIKLLEKEIDKGENSRELVRFTAFVNKIQNDHQDKRPMVKTSKTSQSIEDEFLEIFSTTQDKAVVSISCNQPSQEIQTQIPNIAILSKQQKPNYHWLVVNLAILHPYTLSVDEIDFVDDPQVDKFFDDLFSIPKEISGVTVFDDYCNTKHKKFNFLKDKKIKVFYYTCKGNALENKEKYHNLSKILSGKQLFYHKAGHAHTRRIIFYGFIVNPDIDFCQLNRTDNKMWSVHIRFSESRAKEILEIREKDYKKFEPKF